MPLLWKRTSSFITLPYSPGMDPVHLPSSSVTSSNASTPPPNTYLAWRMWVREGINHLDCLNSHLGSSPLCWAFSLPPRPCHLYSWKLGCKLIFHFCYLAMLACSCVRWEMWSGTHGWASPRRTTTSRPSLCWATGTWTRRRSTRSQPRKAAMTTYFSSQSLIPIKP